MSIFNVSNPNRSPIWQRQRLIFHWMLVKHIVHIIKTKLFTLNSSKQEEKEQKKVEEKKEMKKKNNTQQSLFLVDI